MRRSGPPSSGVASYSCVSVTVAVAASWRLASTQLTHDAFGSPGTLATTVVLVYTVLVGMFLFLVDAAVTPLVNKLFAAFGS